MERARKSNPLSIRLPTADESFLRNEAKRLGRPWGVVVEQYLAEAIRMRRFPGVAFRGDDESRRAWVLGTGLDIWEIIGILRDFGEERAMAREYDLTLGQIRIAQAYHREFPEEIDRLLASGRQSEDDFRIRNPFVATFEDSLGPSG